MRRATPARRQVEWYQAPCDLLMPDGNCGPISAGLLLRHLRKRTSAARLIRLSRHSVRHGTYTIGLAIALRAHGLDVRFHSDPDPDPKPLELRLRRVASQIGVTLGGGITVDALIGRVRRGEAAIIAYGTADGGGRFSPIVRAAARRLTLAYAEQAEIDADDFDRRWRAPGQCRQCLFVAR